MVQGNADAYFNRGWLYEYKGDPQLAEKDYSRAIELDKKHKDAYYNRGLLRGLAFLAKGNKPKAMEGFNKAAQAGHPKAKDQLKPSAPKS